MVYKHLTSELQKVYREPCSSDLLELSLFWLHGEFLEASTSFVCNRVEQCLFQYCWYFERTSSLLPSSIFCFLDSVSVSGRVSISDCIFLLSALLGGVFSHISLWLAEGVSGKGCRLGRPRGRLTGGVAAALFATFLKLFEFWLSSASELKINK